MLRALEASVDAVRIEGHEVPVKPRISDSLFVPLAKWSMLLAGNYRCILPDGARSIREAVHDDPALSRSVYEHVDAIARRLGAEREAQVPFEKYARAAESLLKPSSAARAVTGGAPLIERVDRLVQLVGRQLCLDHPALDEIVATVDAALARNQVRVA